MSILFGCVDFTGKHFEPEADAVLLNSVKNIEADWTTLFSEKQARLGVVRQQLTVFPELAYPGGGDILLIADVRLDNRNELAAMLSIPPERREGMPDDALILEGYRKWKEALPAKLLGDFTFVIFDKKKQSLFCARDQIGIRPFYYAFIDGRFYFHTLQNRITLLLPEKLTPNERVIVGSFVSFFDFSQETECKEVLKLPPGFSLALHAGTSPSLKKYYEIQIPPTLNLRSDAEYAEALRAHIEQAVVSRIQSGYPVASHFSCGLDSATVAIFAARELRKKGGSLHAESWSPNFSLEPLIEHDERITIEKIWNDEGIRGRFHNYDSDVLSRYFATTPYLRGGMFNYRLPESLSRLRQEGVRLLLGGLGGDEFASFHGRGYFADLIHRGQWQRCIADGFMLSSQTRISRVQFLRELGSFFPWQLFKRDQLSDYQAPLLKSKFIGQIAEFDARRIPLFPRNIKTSQLAKLQTYIVTSLERYAEQSDLYGIRHLFPLLDLRVIEYILSVPNEQYLKAGWNRSLMRRATEGILPAEIRIHQSKAEPALNLLNERYSKNLSKQFDQRISEIRGTEIFQKYIDEVAFEACHSQREDLLKRLLFVRACCNILALESLFIGKKV